MIETFNSENRGDWNARYSGTFGLLKKDESKQIAKDIVVRIIEANETNVTFVNEDDMQLRANIDSGIKFEFVPLKTGWYLDSNLKPHLVRRNAARQWKRGICIDNTTVNVFHVDRLVNTDISFLLVSSILMGEYKYTDSYQLWKDNKASSCALSRFFALSENLVYLLNKCIGTVEKRNIITLLDPLVRQELQDCINRGKYDLVMQ